MNRGFWKNKKVLITGFEGFLGSNLTKAMLSLGTKVFGLDIKVHRKDTILSASDYKKLVVIKGSVADYTLVNRIIKKNKINVIFHLAAEAIVGNCHNDPLCTFSSNIKGTWNILEASRNSRHVQALIIASSDKAYGAHKKLPYKEDAPLIGRHPYDVSKSCADLIAHAYFYTYRVPVAVTRCGNIYGPGDFNFSRIVPDALKCALNAKTLLIRSDGKFTRDYVYVDDIVNGYITLAEKLKSLKLAGEAFNFSNEKPITVIELVEKVFATAGKKSDYKILNKAKYEIRHQYLAANKAREVLSWRAQHSLESGLLKTIEWMDNVI